LPDARRPGSLRVAKDNEEMDIFPFKKQSVEILRQPSATEQDKMSERSRRERRSDLVVVRVRVELDIRSASGGNQEFERTEIRMVAR